MGPLILAILTFISILVVAISSVIPKLDTKYRVILIIVAALVGAIIAYNQSHIEDRLKPFLDAFQNTQSDSNIKTSAIIKVRKENLEEARRRLPKMNPISEIAEDAKRLHQAEIDLDAEYARQDKELELQLKEVGKPILDVVLQEFDELTSEAELEGYIKSTNNEYKIKNLQVVGVSPNSRNIQPITQIARKILFANGGEAYVKVNTAYARKGRIQGGHIIIGGGKEWSNLEFYQDIIVVEVLKGANKRYNASALNSKSEAQNLCEDIRTAVVRSFRGAIDEGLND